MNYTSLVSQIQAFLEDDSTELQASIDDIIIQAESMIFQRLPSLPCFRKTSIRNLATSQPEYTIADARMIRQVAYVEYSAISNGAKTYLDHRVDSYLRDYLPTPNTYDSLQTPQFYSTKNATTSGIIITIAPAPFIQASDAENQLEVDFIAPETGLSASNANTWIGDNAEAVLLPAALYETSSFLKASETLQLYKAQFDEAIALFQQEMSRNYTAEYNAGI
jgi:hypothetical protein